MLLFLYYFIPDLYIKWHLITVFEYYFFKIFVRMYVCVGVFYVFCV